MSFRIGSCASMSVLGTFVLVGVLAACSSTATGSETSSPPASSAAPSSSSSDAPSPAPTSSSSPSKDAGSSPTASTSTLAVSSATYTNGKWGSTKFLFDFTFDVENTADVDLTKVEEIAFDFGGGKIAKLSAYCPDDFAVAAGETKSFRVKIVIDDEGKVSSADTNVICAPGKQDFGAASGEGPAQTGLTSAVAIAIKGLTKTGTFSAAGSASADL